MKAWITNQHREWMDIGPPWRIIQVSKWMDIGPP